MVLNSYWSSQLSKTKKDRLVEILDMKTLEEKILQEAIDILHESGSVKYAETKARNLLEGAWGELEPSLPEGEGKKMLEELSLYLIDRNL